MTDDELDDELDDEEGTTPDPEPPKPRKAGSRRITAELSETDRELLRNTAKSTSELVNALIEEPHQEVLNDGTGKDEHGIESSIVEPPPPPTPKQEDISKEAQLEKKKWSLW
jgi:hypothetical protein